MAKLTKDEIKHHRAEFEQWQEPAEMLSHYERISSRMTGEEFFKQPGIHFVREAWVAATLGDLRSVDEVRLIPGRDLWPDFELRHNGKVDQWEVTEADIPERQRGQEYRDDPLLPGDRVLGLDHPENYITRAEFAPVAIRNACTRKASKEYSGSASLLVHLNISDFGARHDEILRSLGEATAPAKDKFKEVCVLWKGRAYTVWRDGKHPPSLHRNDSNS